ncbi:hypothetical protein AD945_01880 [Gluconobacter albidus]|uniref:Uncharacterized protein n=1 Tax=Gluconobacter albidus TaxID=318683 RepID=A0A149TN08_9PROT|nr:hypothetical protein AD945_01880 [Gluconobacter albidus]
MTKDPIQCAESFREPVAPAGTNEWNNIDTLCCDLGNGQLGYTRAFGVSNPAQGLNKNQTALYVPFLETRSPGAETP